jgi:hypothetical protein
MKMKGKGRRDADVQNKKAARPGQREALGARSLLSFASFSFCIKERRTKVKEEKGKKKETEF